MRFLLIANPTAGQGRVRWIAGLLQSAIEHYGVDVTLILTGGPRDAAEAARYAVESRRFDRVVAAGGDGTINQVVTQLVGTDLPLAILPMGTANTLARELCLPLDIVRAARVAVQGPTTLVDVGRAADQYFLLEASAGFDADVVTSVDTSIKKWIGPFAYVLNGLTLLRGYAPFKLRCTCDGEVVETQANMVMAANTSIYVYGVRLARQASMHDGMLDLCILEAVDRPFNLQVVAALFNRLGPRVGARTIRAREILIESDPVAAVQIDGDPAGHTPITISCVPGALRVVVPERYARRLARANALRKSGELSTGEALSPEPLPRSAPR